MFLEKRAKSIVFVEGTSINKKLNDEFNTVFGNVILHVKCYAWIIKDRLNAYIKTKKRKVEENMTLYNRVRSLIWLQLFSFGYRFLDSIPLHFTLSCLPFHLGVFLQKVENQV